MKTTLPGKSRNSPKSKGKAARVLRERPRDAPKIRGDLTVRSESAGHVYILHPASRTHFFVIFGLAANLWHEFDGKVSVKEHIDRLIRKYPGVPPSRIKRDVRHYVAGLRKQGLLA